MKKSDYNHIDGLFQDHLLGHEVAVNNRDKLWSRIQKRPDRKIYFFLLFGALVGTCGLLLSSQSVSAAGGGGAHSDDSSISNYTEEVKDHDIQLGSMSLDISSEQSVIENVAIDNTKDNELKHQQKVDANPLRVEDESTSSSSSSSSSSSFDALANKRNISPSLITIAKKRDVEMNNMLEYVVTKEEESLRPVDASLQQDAQVSSSLESTMAYKNKVTQVAYLNVTSWNLKNELPLLPEFKNGKMEKCLVSNSLGGPYIDLYSNFSLPFDHLSLNEAFQDQLAYRDTWNERNNTLPSISGGLSLGYEFRNGLDISVGVEYQKMESQYTYTQTINEVTTVFDPMAYFFVDDQGQTVWVADSVTAINRYDRTVSFGSTTTLINVPLQVSYPLVRKGPWEIKAAAAGIFNITTQNRGQFLRDDLMLQPIDAGNEATYYKSTIGLSYELGVHFGYHLNDHLELYASTRFRYNPTSFLVDTSPLHLSRSFGGLRIGTQYHF